MLSVVGEMKMGNIVPRAGIEPTSLASWASVLPFHHVGSLMSPLYIPMPIYMLIASEVSSTTLSSRRTALCGTEGIS